MAWVSSSGRRSSTRERFVRVRETAGHVNKVNDILGPIVDQLEQGLAGEGAVVTRRNHDSIDVSDPSTKPGRQITVLVRDDGDVDVAFHIPEKRGSPFEQVIIGSTEDAEGVLASVVRFVADLVGERLILIWDKRLLSGGRRFIAPADLSATMLKHCSWVVSWRGTYDSDESAVQR